MRVLMTADTVGGVWTYAMELSRGLAGRGVEILLATMGNPVDSAQRAEAEACPNLRLAESRYKLEWMDEPWSDIRDAGKWLMDLRRDFRPDVVHLNGFCHGDLDWDAPVVMVVHSCVLTWWRAVRGEEAPQSWNEYRQRTMRGLKAASIVVAPSQAMLESASAVHGPFRSTRVIYNGRDSEAFRPLSKEYFILSAGRLWDEAKNVRLLQESAASIIWPIRVAGAQQRPDGREDRRPAGVRMLGHLAADELAAAYGHASIYAAPALYEPFGLSILEAALTGCALVLGDIRSLREIWADAAFYANPQDSRQFAEQINNLCANPALRRTMSLRSRERACRYTPTRMAEGYMQTYRELLGEPAVRASSEMPDWAGLHA